MGRRDEINAAAMGIVGFLLFGGMVLFCLSPTIGGIAILAAAAAMLLFIFGNVFR